MQPFQYLHFESNRSLQDLNCLEQRAVEVCLSPLNLFDLERYYYYNQEKEYRILLSLL